MVFMETSWCLTSQTSCSWTKQLPVSEALGFWPKNNKNKKSVQEERSQDSWYTASVRNESSGQ